jgi:hypothetical protein
MRILGLDISLNSTGMCLYAPGLPVMGAATGKDGNNIRWETFQLEDYVFQEMFLNSQVPKWQRWSVTLKEMFGIMSAGEGHLKVWIEDYSYGSSGQATISQAEIGGIIRHELITLGKSVLTLHVVSPSLLKKFVTGKGTSPKDLMLKEVYKRWKMDLSSHNLADAFSLVKFGEAFYKCSSYADLTKDQRQIIEKYEADAVKFVQG